MARTSFRALDAGKAIEHIVLALAAARRRGDATPIPRVFTEASLDRVRLMPPWVARAALMRTRGAWWLWCEPRRGTRTGSGQFVMDVPPGRYMVDVLDTRVHAWFSRESAAAAPLVAGLPGTGAAALVKIRRVPGSGSRPLVHPPSSLESSIHSSWRRASALRVPAGLKACPTPTQASDGA